MLQKAHITGNQIAEKKKHLVNKGYLVVTIVEGKENMEKGLQEVVRNHLH